MKYVILQFDTDATRPGASVSKVRELDEDDLREMHLFDSWCIVRQGGKNGRIISWNGLATAEKMEVVQHRDLQNKAAIERKVAVRNIGPAEQGLEEARRALAEAQASVRAAEKRLQEARKVQRQRERQADAFEREISPLPVHLRAYGLIHAKQLAGTTPAGANSVRQDVASAGAGEDPAAAADAVARLTEDRFAELRRQAR